MTRTIYTSVTPLPPGVPRHVVKECLHDHFLMIDLNPLVIKRERMPKALGKATPEEFNCAWYEITDRISYLPGIKGQVTYHGAFHDLENGLQTHIYAPMGLDIKEKWTVGGNEPGEPRQTAEIGIQAPKDGLYLREDVDLSVNMVLLSFVKKNLVNSHKQLVARMVERAKLIDNAKYNESLRRGPSQSNSYSSQSSPQGDSFPISSTSSGQYTHGQRYSTHDDQHYAQQGQGWRDPNTGPTHGPAPTNPPPRNPQRLSVQELPTTGDKSPAELP